MAEILITGMEMPKEVNHPLYIRILSDGHIAKWDSLNGRFIETEATAQELPTHGRLIDANFFKKYAIRVSTEDGKEYIPSNYVDIVPTIIEASK